MKSTSLYALLALTVALSLHVAASQSLDRVISSKSSIMEDVVMPLLVRRRREASVFSAAEIEDIVDLHNEIRAGECANNMERMVSGI